MKLKTALLFTSLLFASAFCMAQSPTGTRAVATTQINVRIPSFAIINLGQNNSKTVSYKPAAELKKSIKSSIPADVISNTKWAVNVIKEEEKNTLVANNTSASNTLDNTSTLTVVYITSLN